MTKVFVGMSGGVDSSVTAALLLEQGYDVTGVFMKNWAQDLPGFKCPWREDLADAKRVAVQLRIPFKIYDFQTQYKQKVVDYMIEAYEAGLTPNPDIMCNQEVKFKLFLETALEDGADMIATGHYARITQKAKSKKQQGSVILSSTENPVEKLERSESASSIIHNLKSNFSLQQAIDTNKDQTYFLYRVTEEALAKTLFPLGEMTKPDVRKKATELGLVTASKKDSVGICFVGEIGIKDFLSNFVETKPGKIIDTATHKVVGEHEGAIFYTIGQRHGLNVGGGLPYYVVGKDMQKNEVHVTTDINDAALWRDEIQLVQPHWIGEAPHVGESLLVRTRHRASLERCSITKVGERVAIKTDHPLRAVTEGQSAVLYRDDICLGGGIII